jgi:fatty-acyl-CoA synthase
MERLIRSAECSEHGLVTADDGGFTRRTWGEIHQLARRMSSTLASAGIGSGSRVAVLSGAPAEVVPVVQAIWLRGAAVTMLQQPSPRTDPRVWRDDTARALSMVGAEVLIAGKSFEAGVEAASFAISTLPVASLAGGDDIDPVPVRDEDAALLQLSSGSTGRPKAIVVSHRNLYANIVTMSARWELSEQHDTLVSWLPLFHDMGMIAFLALPMMAGMELVKSTPLDFLAAPVLWTELISRFGGTFTAAPNFAYSLLARRLAKVDDGRLDLSTVRYAINGAEPIDCPAMQRFVTEAGRFGWPEGALVGSYGMAEAVLGISSPAPGSGLAVDYVDPAGLEADGSPAPRAGGRPLAKLGVPFDGMTVRVVDERGRPLPDRRVGELEIRGESVTCTYVTEEGAFDAQDTGGWLRTGDLGYRTEDGQLVICGRKKDVIIVSGRNIYPTEIERAVEEIDGVRKGGVIAVSIDAGRPGEGFAVIAEEMAGTAHPEASNLRRLISARVFDAVGVVPRQVLTVAPGDVPKTSSGKLQRGRARQMFL